MRARQWCRCSDSDFWFDPVWVTDSTPVECGRSRSTAKRSDMAGWAGYGYCASHSRYFWGLRLYLVCTPAGMPILWALAHPKIDEREVLLAMIDRDEQLITSRPGILLIAGKGFASAESHCSWLKDPITAWSVRDHAAVSSSRVAWVCRVGQKPVGFTGSSVLLAISSSRRRTSGRPERPPAAGS